MINIKSLSFGILCLSIILLIGCGQKGQETESLEGKKTVLLEKKKALGQLKADIIKLENEIKNLDPAYEGSSTRQNMSVVTIMPVKKQNFEKFVNVQGVVESKGDFNISAEMGGTIRRLNIKEGDMVRRGQVIASLDTEILDKNVQELELQLNLAKDVFQRREKLWNQKIGSEIEFVQAKNNVESLEKKIATLQSQKGKYTVYSPANGVVDMVISKQGELAAPGMPIAKIIDVTNVQIVADVSENYLNVVKKGDQVLIDIPSLGEQRPAKITSISPTINSINRTFKIEMAANNKDRKLKPNLMVTVKLSESAEENSIVIPTNLVQQDIEGDYVFVADKKGEDNISKKVYIELGDNANGQSVVKEGLNGGEQLIVEGYKMVKEGQVIKVL